MLERGLPVLLGREWAGGDASLADRLQALPQPAMHTLLAAVHAAARACLAHRTGWVPAAAPARASPSRVDDFCRDGVSVTTIAESAAAAAAGAGQVHAASRNIFNGLLRTSVGGRPHRRC